MVDVHQVAAHEAWRRVVGDAYGQVHGVIDQVHVAVFQPHLHVDLGIQGQEVGHVGMDHGMAHGLGHADAHQAARLRVLKQGCSHDGLRGAHHVQAARMHLAAGLAQAQLARGAFQQAQAQSPFQPRHAPAGGRWRAAQLARGLGEAARVHHLDEDGHFSEQG